MSDSVTEKKRNRFGGHTAFHQAIKSDWYKAIQLDPNSFDALLYLPISESEENTDSGNYEDDIFSEVDSTQTTLQYADPVVVPVVDCPDELESFSLMADNETNMNESELPLILRVGVEGIPSGSVLEWEEEITPEGKTRRVWWYIHRSYGLGTVNVGTLYVCIPCRDFHHELSTSAGDKL